MRVANGSPQWVHTNVYASGELIATDDTNETHFYLNDYSKTRVDLSRSHAVQVDATSRERRP